MDTVVIEGQSSIERRKNAVRNLTDIIENFGCFMTAR